MPTQLLQTGVHIGCDVIQRAAGANMSVDVLAGDILYQNVTAQVAAGNVVITAADPLLDRIDAIVASPAGVLSAIAGALNDGANAVAPDTTGFVLLGTVYVLNQASAQYTGTIVTVVITSPTITTPPLVLLRGSTKRFNLLNGTTTYTPTAGVVALDVECLGGGGAGGGAATAAGSSGAGGGGSSGSWSNTYSTTNVVGAHTVAIGAGGTAGAAGNNPGNDGGDTTFKDTAAATICSGLHGVGGGGSTFYNPTATVVSGNGGGNAPSGVGDVAAGGNAGDHGFVFSGTAGVSGAGAPGPWGGGALARVNGTNDGVAGGLYGGGGSGGLQLNGGGARKGGVGGNGLIRVREYS